MFSKNIISDIIDYIDDNLTENLTLENLALRAGLSEFHFHRLFTALTRQPLIKYIRQRRITLAAIWLLSTQKPIVEIAHDCGYESQSTFNRYFTKIFKMSPGAYRKANIEKIHLLQSKLDFNKHSTKPLVRDLSYRVEKLETKKMRGLYFETSMKEDKEEGRVLQKWAELLSSIDAAHALDTIRTAYMINTDYRYELLSTGEIDERWRCFVGFEYNDEPAGFRELDEYTLQESSYLVFSHKGEADKLKDSYAQIWSHYLPKLNIEVASSFVMEVHGEDNIRNFMKVHFEKTPLPNLMYSPLYTTEIYLKLGSPDMA